MTPRAIEGEDEGWFDWLWNDQDSLAIDDHEAIERMLRQAVNAGTGRAAMLSGPNFGKTGTTQNSRDALFVGYAGDLVVGVWVGNDDGSPLAGVSGGGLPARIWKDFMQQALGERATPAPRPSVTGDPSGPVQPQDLPELPEFPIDERSRIGVRDGEPVLSTDIQGVPFTVGPNGVQVDRGALEERAREAQQRFEERAAEVRQQAEERIRERQEQRLAN